MLTTRRLAKVLPALALAVAALAVPSSAFGQATRTWVSGVGDDANPCSRTAPCKTFAGAISKTAAGGEINCIDSGGFGGVTITKSLAIKCRQVEGGVLVSGTNAIVVNAAATDKVTLVGLDINGIGTGAPTSLVGVKVLSAKQVNIFENEIYRFQAGVAIEPTSAQTRTVLRGNHIHDNGVGVFNGPGINTVSFTSAVLRYNDIQDNTCGVVVSAFGANASTPNANTDCGAATSANAGGINSIATLSLYHNGINLNPTAGVFSRGANATAEIGWNDITDNGLGLHRVDGGNIKTITGTNAISANGGSDAPNQSQAATKRAAKVARG